MNNTNESVSTSDVIILLLTIVTVMTLTALFAQQLFANWNIDFLLF